MIRHTAVKKSVLALGAFLAIGAGAGLTALASAATASDSASSSTIAHVMGDRKMEPGIHGTVSAIDGTTITVVSKGFGSDATETTYTVDASGATFLKSTTEGQKPAEVTISDIAVGDEIGVRGTVSGTSVTATEIMDGLMRGGPGGFGKGHGTAGTVSAVDGDTITITAKDGTSYTVDASNAKVSKVVDINVSDIKVGDEVGVEGSVSGSSVTAVHIMDGIPSRANGPPEAQ